MKILEYMEKHDYEQLAFYTDRAVGLRAIIAIHDTTLGPALGGARMWPYPSEEEAVLDALRLARAMTYKNSAAGLPLGGGKAVILGDPARDKAEALLNSFGQFVESLGGRYITTEDVGMTPRDMEHISAETSHVVGLPQARGGSGDPSVLTALGIFQAMRACAKEVWGTDSLQGKRVALQGLGHVSSNLLPHLLQAGARAVACDVRPQAARQAQERHGIQIVEPEEIYDIPCDIFSPCALGSILNDQTIPRLGCRLVAGAANNQLAEDRHAEELMKRGILYAPDFIINAGGVINLSFELNSYDPEAARARVMEIYQTTERVLSRARAEGVTPAQAAELLAEERIQAARRVKRIYLE